MKNQKTILFVAPTPALDSGGELSHLELIRGAVSRGYHVRVVLPARGQFSNTLRGMRIKHTIIKYSWWSPNVYEEYLTAGLASVSRIAEYVKQEGIDIVVTNTLNIPWAAMAASLSNKPHVWIAREFPLGDFKYLANKYAFIDKFSNRVIANSKNLADYMNEKKLVSLPAYFFSYVDTKGLRLSKPKSKMPPRLVTIGAIQERKNQIEVLKALKVIHDNGHKNVKALFIGRLDPGYLSTLMKYTTKNKLEDSVIFVGEIKKPWQHVTENDIFIQPSMSESIGRTITEAMKLGVYSVGADIPGTSEAVSLGGGSLYKLGDVDALAQTLIDILRRKSYYMKKSKIIQRKVLKTMSEESSSGPFFRVIEECLTSKLKGKLAGTDPIFETLTHFYAYESDRVNKLKLQHKKEVDHYKKHIDSIESSLSWRLIKILRGFIKG